MKRAQVPTTNDPTSAALLSELENPDLDHAQIVALREKLLEHDPNLFERYMAAIRARPGVEKALDSDSVYRDNF